MSVKNKVALITGISGQDGSYLTELLLNKGYIVHGVVRRSSLIKTDRIDKFFNDKNFYPKRFMLHYGDMNDSSSLQSIILKVRPTEIYNLAAQSHVKVSFEIPEYTANSDALGTMRVLEIIRSLNLKTKFYQASTSEMFGKTKLNTKQNEKTLFIPRSPYGAAKLYAHWITTIYRESYNIFACSGILFNHESPLRGKNFVTKKIVDGISNYILKGQSFSLGNIYAMRDWGHAKDFVEAMWRIMQYKKPDDFVIATGDSITIKDFVNKCLKYNKINFKWSGKKFNEKCIDTKSGSTIIKIDKKQFRPLEVDYLKGDYSKAKKLLKWKPKFSIDDLIIDMFQN